MESSLTSDQLNELTTFICSTFSSHNMSLRRWRDNMTSLEKRMEDDFEDRASSNSRDYSDSALPQDIFFYQNDSLNVVGGFADFAFAQAKNDLFGTNPFMGVSPEGIEDDDLADRITKHSHWKSSNTNQKRSLMEALQLSIFLGTSFPKVTWIRRIEEYEKLATVMIDASGKPIVTASGDYIYLEDEIVEGEPETTDPNLIQRAVKAVTPQRQRIYPAKDPSLDLSSGKLDYKEMLVKETQTIYDNGDFHNVNFRDISFDITAPSLDLRHTAVFHQFKKSIHDARYDYNLGREDYAELVGEIGNDADNMGRSPNLRRGEAAPAYATGEDEEKGNPLVRLVEGYIRVDPFGGNKPVRIYVVFCPEIEKILTLDYLANVTPEGQLPIFALPTYRTPGRITGRGFLEKFGKVQDCIDAHFNSVTWHNRINSNPFTGYNPLAINGEINEENPLVPSMEKPYELKEGFKMDAFIDFKSLPDLDNRTMELINIIIEIAQMRTGISSASQGEMSSLPQANTATGVKSLMSRAATLLKWVIDDMRDGITPVLKYWIHLLYANHSHEETFKWGEGENATVLALAPEEVKNLRYNVKVLMVQSQAEEKLSNAQMAMGIHGQYVQLPEHEKTGSRALYTRALKSLGFDDAEEIIRTGIVDIEGLLAVLPPELQEPFIAFMQSQQTDLPQSPAGGGETPPPPG